MKSPDLNRRWARSPWTTNCCPPRSPPWRPKALWPEGGRDDEPDGLAFDVAFLWPGAGRARGVFRALARIVFSSERPRLRSPVAAVRQALCQSASKTDPGLECAPRGGHNEGLGLTVGAGLSEDESHDQASFP